MKEATGELNMTVVAIVAIAAVGAFFYAFVWPAIQTNIRLSNACSTAGSGDYHDSDNGIVCADGTCCVAAQDSENCDSATQRKVCVDANNTK